MPRDGVIAVVGRPNAGKSTLVNALVGHKVAIVSPRPQTTRHRLRGVLRTQAGRIVFLDTPGTHRPLHRMNREMMDAVRSGLSSADAIAVLVDATDRGGGGLDFLLDLVRPCEQPKVLVLTKVDLVRKAQLLPLISKLAARGEFAAVVPVSAVARDGLDILVGELFRFLPEVEAVPEEDPPEASEEFRIAEAIREALLSRCGEELPYTTAVRIESNESRAETGGVRRVGALVCVDRHGQKKIVVGAGGRMIRDIGIDARKAIEEMLGERIHLDLHVVVEEGWRESPRFLSQLPEPGGWKRFRRPAAEGDAAPQDDFSDEGELPDPDDADDDDEENGDDIED